MRRERDPSSEPDCHIIYDEDSHGAVVKAFAFVHLVHGLGLIAEEATRQLVCDCDVTLYLSLPQCLVFIGEGNHSSYVLLRA